MPCSLAVLLSLHATAQSKGTPPATANDVSCREKAFGSTPETRGKLVTLPKRIHKVQPIYPSDARKAHVEGVVVLCVTIGKDGDVTDVHAASGPSELIPSAVKALRQWRFRPFLANGQPVEASMEIRVNFRLTGIQITAV